MAARFVFPRSGGREPAARRRRNRLLMAKPSDETSQSEKPARRKGDRVIATNRKAFHEYLVGERFEAGLALTGSEVKSLRQGQASLGEAYAAAEGGEIFVHNLHIPPYDPASYMNHDPRRKRKLLLHRKEIHKIEGFVTRKGQTLIPLELRFQNGYAKLVVALATGKKAHDKRHAIAEREAKREVSRALRQRSRGGSDG